MATQFFSALSLILTGCGFLVAILLHCVSKFQNGIVVPLFMMALFYGAGKGSGMHIYKIYVTGQYRF